MIVEGSVVIKELVVDPVVGSLNYNELEGEITTRACVNCNLELYADVMNIDCLSICPSIAPVVV